MPFGGSAALGIMSRKKPYLGVPGELVLRSQRQTFRSRKKAQASPISVAHYQKHCTKGLLIRPRCVGAVRSRTRYQSIKTRSTAVWGCFRRWHFGKRSKYSCAWKHRIHFWGHFGRHNDRQIARRALRRRTGGGRRGSRSATVKPTPKP